MYSGWVEGVFVPRYCGVFLRRVEGATVCFVFAPKEKRGLESTVFFILLSQVMQGYVLGIG